MYTLGRVSAAIVLAAVLSGCAGGPDLASRRVPDWVLDPPESDAQTEVFVVSASGETAALAEEAAGYALLNQINQALGVDITVETSATARASLDSYETDLVQQVTQTGTGRVEGLRVSDRYISEQAGTYVVYLLGEYERGAFVAERARRESLLREERALLRTPEAEADRLVAAGRLTQAISAYVAAASAAAGSGLPEAPVVLERSLQKATEASGRMQLTVASGPATIELGDGDSEPVVFVLSDDRGNPIGGAGIDISYVERRGSRDTVRTVSSITNDNGEVLFRQPAPQAVGEFSVTARLQTDALQTLLGGLPTEFRDQANALVNGLVNARATHRFIVLSQARTIPTAILIQDLDAAGRMMPGARASAGIVEALSSAGFITRVLRIDENISALSASEIIAKGAALAGGDRRLVYGTAAIVETRNEDGILVKVSGTVTAVDIESGRILYSTSGVKNARSQTSDRAISAAFGELGRQLGEDLAANLP